MGIGDWAQSPIPNPQSPTINNMYVIVYKICRIINYTYMYQVLNI
jgi:hypothetical protein